MIKLTPDAWLAEIMARPVHRAAVDGDGANSLDKPHGFYFARIGTEDLRAANALAGLGFRVVDTNVTLERAAGGDNAKPIEHVRDAMPADRDAVIEIARNGFKHSRFHLDPAIPAALANTIKAEWAANYFRGRRGDQMIVAEADNRVAGFLQIVHAADGAMVIDLIAVGAPWRGRGFGGAMVRWAASRTKQSRMRVGTQVANAGSLRFYEDLGFRTVSSAYVMHLHA